MRQHRTSFRKSRITFRTRPHVQRSGFVSFSASSSPKQKVKRCANTSRVPYKYTNKQKWNTFVTNGRPMFHKNCLLLCHVIFESGNDTFWEESHSHLPGAHAEVKALQRVGMKEKHLDTVARLVMLYLSYSPCANCADSILEFSGSRPQCMMSLGFSCLYRHEEESQRDGLRRLNAEHKISLGVFTRREWQHVAQATGMPFRYVVPKRDAWDSKWKAIFETLLTDKEQTTYMFPFVPSEEREWSSVMIPATSFAPERQVTPSGPGRSTTLLQERVFVTPRQRLEVDRAETLNETRIDIPQEDDSVDGHTGRCKKNLRCSILILGIILIATIVLISVFA